MIVTAALALALAAQEPPAPAPNPANADYHFRYLNQLDPAAGWHRTLSGLRWRTVSGPGTGRHPAGTDSVTINYVGHFIAGTELDGSVDPNVPATFPVNPLFRCWPRGAPVMGVW